MALEPQELIIVRRRHDVLAPTAKGGVWKVAYADFTTAMMSFFLLMWLMNASDETTQVGLASYFNPIKLVDAATSPKGVRDPQEVIPNTKETEGVEEGKPLGEGGLEQQGPATGGGAKLPEAVSDQQNGEHSEFEGANAQEAQGVKAHSDVVRDEDRSARYSEAELFDNPYAILAALAAEAEAIMRTDGSPGTGGKGALAPAKTPVLFALPNRDPNGEGLADGTSFRDPFDPSGWQTDELPGNAPLLAEVPILEEKENGVAANELSVEQIKLLEEVSDLARGGSILPGISGEKETDNSVIVLGDAEDQEGLELVDAAALTGERLADLMQQQETIADTDADGEFNRLVFAKSEHSETVIKLKTDAPMEDVSEQTSEESVQALLESAETQGADEPTVAAAPAPKPDELSQELTPNQIVEAKKRAEKENELISLANKVGDALDGLKTGASIEFTSSREGVLIRVMDNEEFGMFAVGSSEPHPEVVKAMEMIAQALSEEEGEVVIRGHTDGRPFKSSKNDNWRLSTARAHMAYYMLTRGGLDKQRVVGIEGYADRRLKEPEDPFAPQNRRIEIMLIKPGAAV